MCTAVEWILRKICRNSSLMIIQLLPRFTKLHRSFPPVRPSFKGIGIQLLELELINELIWNWYSKSGTPKALEIIKQPDERVWRMKTLQENNQIMTGCNHHVRKILCFEFASNFQTLFRIWMILVTVIQVMVITLYINQYTCNNL